MSTYQQYYQLVAHFLLGMWGVLAAVALYLLLPIIIVVTVVTIITAFVGVSIKKRNNLNG